MDYEKKTKRVKIYSKIFRHVTIFMLVLAWVFVASAMYDMYAFTEKGRGESFPGFDELKSRNADIVAWIKLDGTHIDHPVVKGKDHFGYLTEDADGEFYQGGSIFLDAGNARDLSDDYIIIHGHHMMRGAMFSDLSLYLEEEFFCEHKTGELLTPLGDYALTVLGAGYADAYDGEMYHTGTDVTMPLQSADACTQKRDLDFEKGDKLVMLSTCSGDMTSHRIVVFLRAGKVK